MSYTQDLSLVLQHEFFGGPSRNTLLNVKTKRFVWDCPDQTLESVILDMIDKLTERNIMVADCYVTSKEIIFVMEA